MFASLVLPYPFLTGLHIKCWPLQRLPIDKLRINPIDVRLSEIPRATVEFAFTGGVLATSVILPHGGVDDLELCPWKQISGFDCPFCGMTRGFVAISHLDIDAAMDFNPGSPLIYSAFVAVFIRSIWSWKIGASETPPPFPVPLFSGWLWLCIIVFSWVAYSRIIILL